MKNDCPAGKMTQKFYIRHGVREAEFGKMFKVNDEW